MTSYWGIRTSKEKWDVIGEELGHGRLRQGWGARDLREIGREVAEWTASDETKSIWRYTRRMLDIEPGDIVLTPDQPEWGREGVWQVTRGYEFDPLPNIWDGEPDFGHLISVEPFGVIDHRSASVRTDLRRALTSGFRSRMRQLNDFGEQIDALLLDPVAREASSAAAHFEEVRRKARDALYEGLRERYTNADFAIPIYGLLDVIYPGSVQKTAGPNEDGRDFVVEDVDRLGLTRRVIVQVKSWRGAIDGESLRHGLNQLERGVARESGDIDLV